LNQLASIGNLEYVDCPTCRKRHTQPSNGFRIDFKANKLLELLNKVMRNLRIKYVRFVLKMNFVLMKKNSDNSNNFQNDTDYINGYHRLNSARTQPSAPAYNMVEEEPMLTTNEQKKRLSKKWIYRLSIFCLSV
jgi:hypothetical protein